MGILQITTDTAGQINVNPRRVKIITTDSLSTVTTAGYLNPAQLEGYVILPSDVLDIWYGATSVAIPGTYSVFLPSISNGVITLTQYVDGGNVLLPVTSGDFAVFNGTSGQIYDPGYLPSNAAKTNVVMANGATVANHIMVSTDTAGTSGNLTGTAINDGSIQAGLSGTAGTLISFPATAAKGSLIVAGVANTGNTNTTISNAAMGQASVISIPDPGASTANFLLSTGTANLLTDFQITQGVANGMLPNVSTGTWTLTRNAGGNYSYVHTAAANSPIVAWQFSPNIRTTSGKGLTLTSIDVLTTVGTVALTSATPTLSLVNYIAGSAVTVTSVTTTGSLTTATGTFNVDNLAISTPAVDNTANSFYILEVAYVCQTTTALAVYGVTLHYSQTIA